MFYIKAYYRLVKFISVMIYQEIKLQKEKLDTLNTSMQETIKLKDELITSAPMDVEHNDEMSIVECQITNLERDINDVKKSIENIWNEQTDVSERRPFVSFRVNVEGKTSNDIYDYVMINIDLFLSANRLLFSPTKIVGQFLEEVSF